MKAGHLWVGRGSPVAVAVLRGGITLAQIEFHLLGVRRFDAEDDAQVGRDARVLVPRDVGGRGDGRQGAARGRRRSRARGQAGAEGERDEDSGNLPRRCHFHSPSCGRPRRAPGLFIRRPPRRISRCCEATGKIECASNSRSRLALPLRPQPVHAAFQTIGVCH